MNKILLIGCTVVFLLSLGSCVEDASPRVLTPDGLSIVVEVADEAGEREVGLMYREYLPENSGMLFVFDEPQLLSFWMKNTLIPLDVLFLKEDGTIVSIQTMPPCSAETQLCPGYPSGGEALYALEINAGRAAELGLKAGETLEIVIPSPFGGLRAGSAKESP